KNGAAPRSTFDATMTLAPPGPSVRFRRLALAIAAYDTASQRVPVYFARAVVDAESAHIAEDPLHHRVVRDAHAAEDLHRAVHDAEDRLGADHLGHRGCRAGLVALIEQPRAVPDGEPRRVNVHGVVR